MDAARTLPCNVRMKTITILHAAQASQHADDLRGHLASLRRAYGLKITNVAVSDETPHPPLGDLVLVLISAPLLAWWFDHAADAEDPSRWKEPRALGISLSPCDAQGTPWADGRTGEIRFPKKGAVMSYANRDAAWCEVADLVRSTVTRSVAAAVPA